MATNELKTKKVRGTMEYLPEDKLVFTPHGTGQPQYEKLKTTATSALMRTTGEKMQSLVAHLKVPANAVDPASDLREQLEKVLKALPATGEAPVPRGRRLMKKDGVEVRLNAKGSLEIGVKIDLGENADYIKKFYEIMTEINKCLHYNEESVSKLKHALATSSTR